MSEIFGKSTLLTSDLSLMLQLVILAVLIAGVKFAREKRFMKHHKIMVTAVVLHSIGILFVMLPSLVAYISPPQIKLTSITITTIAHALFGALAEISGIAFALNKMPGNLKQRMRLMASIWLIAIVFGIALYLQMAGIF